MLKAMPFCHAGARNNNRPISGVARMHQHENRKRDTRIMTPPHQINDRLDRADLGVERLAHSQTA